MKQIVDLATRQAVIERIKAASAKGQLFYTDFTKAKWLAQGEAAVGVKGGFANMVIFSPRGARGASPIDTDKFLFFGPNGVLEHEEMARGKVDVHQIFSALESDAVQLPPKLLARTADA